MAGKQWAKVWRDVGLSTRLAALMERDPISYGLFWHLKALADDFGRYPNDPERFLMEGAQRMLLNGVVTLSNGVQALSNYVELGLARVYEVDGVEYLELCDFHAHENPNWGSVSAPEHPAPPDWVPPPSLVSFLEENHGKRNITAKRYGITPDNAPKAIKELVRTEYEARSTDIKPRSRKPRETRTDIEPRSTDIELSRTRTEQTRPRTSKAPSPKDGASQTNGPARSRLEDERAGTATADSSDTPEPSRTARPTGHDNDTLALLLPPPPGVPADDWLALMPIWLNKHPPPPNGDTRELGRYRDAAKLWSAGVKGPQEGYEFPPPPDKPLQFQRRPQ